ncbi:oligosaccharide flippase family protein [Arthrobacter crusticola]|nr:oligosaccharide flippase family protein [Arthrobacter crusticola]
MWQALAHSIGRAIVLVTIVVLARLLSPEEYGLVALALVLMAYAEMIADAGVNQALVYLKPSPENSRAALLIAAVVGGSLTVGAVVAAPVIAAVFDRPEVEVLVQVLAISLLGSALAAVPEALLRRDLLFPRLTVAAIIRSVVTGSLALGLAFADYGALSLAVGTVAGTIAYAVSCWLLLPGGVPWKIWRARRAALRANLAFGAPAAGSNLLVRLIFDVDYVIIALLLGAQALGHYTLAFRLPEQLIMNVFYLLSTVVFPLYSRARSDLERLRGGYLKIVQIQSLYGVTAGVGLAVVAHMLVPVVFGDRWGQAVLPLVFLSMYAAVRALGAGATDIYKALGRPGLSVGISLVRLVLLVPLLIYAARWGIAGVAVAQCASALVFALGMQVVAARVLRMRAMLLLRAVIPGLVCGLAVSVVGISVSALPLGDGIPHLAVVIAAGLGTVYLLLRMIFTSLHDELVRLVLRR